jgi:hypothetical protein
LPKQPNTMMASVPEASMCRRGSICGRDYVNVRHLILLWMMLKSMIAGGNGITGIRFPNDFWSLLASGEDQMINGKCTSKWNSFMGICCCFALKGHSFGQKEKSGNYDGLLLIGRPYGWMSANANAI